MPAWTREALGPAQGFQVLGASLIIREELLELRKRRGKAERFHVPIVSGNAGDVNRISMEDWLYLAVILDLASRRVVGYAMSANNDRHLVLDALRMASEKRPNRSAKLIFHSDRGSTYAATECRKALESLGIQCSMSDVGECLDNATTESFNATIKRELIDRHEWKSHDDVGMAHPCETPT